MLIARCRRAMMEAMAMENNTKAAIAFGAIAALSICANVWQYSATVEMANPFAAQAVEKVLKAESERDLRAQAAQHAGEMARLHGELADHISRARSNIFLLESQNKKARLGALAVAKSAPGQLTASIREHAPALEFEVFESKDTLTLTRVAALRWLDTTLKLKGDVVTCPAKCDLRLAEQRAAIEPPLVKARQDAERAGLYNEGALRVATARADALESVCKKNKLDQLWVGLGSGLGGLVLGAALTGAAVVAYHR